MYVKTKDGAVERYPYTATDLIHENRHVSFPTNVDDALLAEWYVYPVVPTERPVVDYTQTAKELDPVLVNGQWTQVWSVVAASQEEIDRRLSALKSQIVTSTQLRLDSFAKTRGYDSILSACSYATSTVPKFKAEGQYCVEARDATWAKLTDMLAEIEAGTRPVPSGFAEIEPELPTLQWPA